MSDEQLEFLNNAKKNDDVIFKQSDKCKGFVIMDRNEYLGKSHAILEDRANYEVIDKNPVPRVEAETKRVFKSVSKGKMHDSTIKELTPCHSRIPVFYGLPKDHKESVPLPSGYICVWWPYGKNFLPFRADTSATFEIRTYTFMGHQRLSR